MVRHLRPEAAPLRAWLSWVAVGLVLALVIWAFGLPWFLYAVPLIVVVAATRVRVRHVNRQLRHEP